MKKPFDSKSTYVNDFKKPGQLPPVQPYRPDKIVWETAREFDDRTVYRDEYVNYRFAPMNFNNKYSKETYYNNKIPSTTNSNSSSVSSSSKDPRRNHQNYDYNQKMSQPRHQFMNNFSNNDNETVSSDKSFGSSSSFILKQFEPRHQNKPKRTKIPLGPKTRLPFETVSLYKADYSDFSDRKNVINSSSYW